jgi:hypothetical protein
LVGWGLDSALALEYVDDLDPRFLEKVEHVRAVLYKNTR